VASGGRGVLASLRSPPRSSQDRRSPRISQVDYDHPPSERTVHAGSGPRGSSPMKSRVTSERAWMLHGALVLLGACTTLRDIRPAQLQGLDLPDSVRVTQTDHSVMVLHVPHVVADTLEGIFRGLGTAVPQRLPLSQVAAIQVRQPAPARTAALVIGGTAVTVALTYFLIEQVNAATMKCAICPSSSVTSGGAGTCCNNPVGP
jgi:hypothetical protein